MLRKDVMINCVWIGIGVSIKQSDPIFQELSQMNSVLKSSFGCIYNLDKPHLNLYDIDVPTNSITKIQTILQKTAKSTIPLDVGIESIDYFPFGFIFLRLALTEKLKKLHINIVESISPLKNTCVCAGYLQPNRKYSEKQKQMLTLYGNPYVLDQFQPHITIGNTKNANLEEIKNKLGKMRKSKILKIDNLHMVTNDKTLWSSDLYGTHTLKV